MCAGDFLMAFKDDSEKFDAVVSVFFIDTAVNPIAYIRTIHRILKPGGVWVNFGPLTYHYEGSEEDLSLELPYEQIIKVVEKIGFRVEKNEGRGVSTPASYTCNQDSMLTYIYNCGFFECVKL
jgi:carnosine N-methyltransferase